MYHWRKYKSKIVISQTQCRTILYFQFLPFQIQSEEILDHYKCLRIGYYCSAGIYFQKVRYICCMVRLHMLNDQIVRLTSAKCLFKIIQPFMFEIGIYSIHNCNLVIQNHIGIICHSVWHCILSLKQIYLMVINSDIFNGICNLHISALNSFFIVYRLSVTIQQSAVTQR